MIKNKVVGWIVGIFFVFLSKQKLALFIAMLLGSLQYQLLGRSLILAPFCMHRMVECLFCGCIKNRESFISISQVENNLKLYIKSGKLEKSQVDEGEAI